MKRAAIYPGSFDPFTLGHMDIAQRALKLFDQVYIAIGENTGKAPLFSVEERKSMISKTFKDDSRVNVIVFDTLLVDLMKELDTNVVIRGLRAVSDFEMELQMASVNRVLYSSSESVFLMTSDKYSFLSSGMVKEIASMNKSCLGKFVPPAVEAELKKEVLTMTHTFLTPAKINIFLKIGDIDKHTNLHKIQSVMVPISLFDTVSVKMAETITINTVGINENISTEKNIIYKMLLATQKYIGRKLPKFEITIDKKIPTGAGLGGGSSNAAGFLMFVNEQLKLGLKKQDMINIAATVGSDVPFFILQSPAFVSGTGDKLNPVTINSQGKSLLLIYPEITVNSGLAYSLFDKKKLTKTEGVTINTVRNFDCRSLKDWTTVIHNDFEDVVFSQWPEIGALKNELAELAQTAFMSGSGSAVIGVFSSLEQRERAYEVLRDKYRLIEKIELLT